MSTSDLLLAHKYSEAVECAKREYADLWPNEEWTMASLAEAYFVNGEYTNAIPLYSEVGKLERADPAAPGRPGRDNCISVAHWCLGNRDEAIRLMKSLCAGILNGKIKYSSSTGGGEQGLLLHYMATTAKDGALSQYALDYMKKVLAQQAKYYPHTAVLELGWPLPLMAFVLGETSYAQVMKFATSSRLNSKETTEDPAEARLIANTDLMTRRRLTNVYLQEATLARARGDETACMAKMRACYEMENPIIEAAWYLARYEISGK
jgi:tetratricopeptide (TPR) repeat protein